MENDSGDVRLAPMVIRERKERLDEMDGSTLDEASDGSNECCECEEGVMLMLFPPRGIALHDVQPCRRGAGADRQRMAMAVKAKNEFV